MELSKDKKERILWLDLLKAFAIFLVLWGHCIQHLLPTEATEEPMYRFIYSFHMPLFMMLSGFFAASARLDNIIFVVTKKFRQLMLPVVTIVCTWLIVNYITKGITLGIGVENPFRWFWFLKSAFICACFYLLATTSKKYFYPLIIVTLMIAYFAHYYMIHFMYPCFVVGAMLRKNINFVEKYYKAIGISCASIFFLLYLGYEISVRHLVFQNVSIGDKLVKFTFDYAYIVIMGIAGSITCFCLFKNFENKCQSSYFINKLSKVGNIPWVFMWHRFLSWKFS